MASFKLSELREMSVPELEEKIVELRSQLSRERALISSGTRPENPGKIKKIRKNIARLLTVLNEKKLSEVKVKK
jgi:large subunit ribosomal protein L29